MCLIHSSHWWNIQGEFRIGISQSLKSLHSHVFFTYSPEKVCISTINVSLFPFPHGLKDLCPIFFLALQLFWEDSCNSSINSHCLWSVLPIIPHVFRIHIKSTPLCIFEFLQQSFSIAFFFFTLNFFISMFHICQHRILFKL